MKIISEEMERKMDEAPMGEAITKEDQINCEAKEEQGQEGCLKNQK